MSENPLDQVEIWEATTESSVWIWVLDTIAGNGSWKIQKVGGRYGNRRIQLTVRERRYNQDRVPQQSASEFDPFLNGKLICRQGADQSPNGYTDDQLIALLTVESARDSDFETVAQSMISKEVVVRRLLALAERHAPAYRRDMLEELVDQNYRLGWTQRSLRDDIPDKGVGNGVLISR